MVPSLFCISKSRCFALDCALNMNGPPEMGRHFWGHLHYGTAPGLVRFLAFPLQLTMFVHLCLQLRSPSGAALCERLCVKVLVEASVCKSVCVCKCLHVNVPVCKSVCV